MELRRETKIERKGWLIESKEKRKSIMT